MRAYSGKFMRRGREWRRSDYRFGFPSTILWPATLALACAIFALYSLTSVQLDWSRQLGITFVA
jgi:hypothetical protein